MTENRNKYKAKLSESNRAVNGLESQNTELKDKIQALETQLLGQSAEVEKIKVSSPHKEGQDWEQ